jgi:hypothetical protein
MVEKKERKILIIFFLVFLSAILLIGFFVGRKQNDYTETKNNYYPEISKIDSIHGFITKNISYNGFIYITIDNKNKFLTGGDCFQNDGYLNKNDLSIYNILKEGAFIEKKSENDTLKVSYQNNKYIFIMIYNNQQSH